jgi:hypothetical protein
MLLVICFVLQSIVELASLLHSRDSVRLPAGRYITSPHCWSQEIHEQ